MTNESEHCRRRPGPRHAVAWAVAIVAGLAFAADAGAESLEVIVDRLDGEVFLKNTGAIAETIDGYQITSAGGALLPAGWTSITDNYALSGDQSVDEASDWFVIAVPSATAIAEASLQASSGELDAGEFVSLGLLFDTSFPETLDVSASAGAATSTLEVDFRTLTADYDGDLDVDLDDYGIFASTFGSTVDLRADGNDDGVINAIDYTIWRDSEELGVVTPIVATLLGGGAAIAVPEPGGFLIAASCLAISRGWQRRWRSTARPS